MSRDPTESPERVAAALLDAARTGQPIEPPTAGWHGMSKDDAYAVQLKIRESRLLAGETLVGRKIGLTSKAMQEMLGVGEPDFGFITDRMVFQSGETIPWSTLIAPRVEAEVAFRFREALPTDAGFEAIVAPTTEIAPALEVIDSRVSDWRISIADTIADNASSAFVVVGDFVPLAEIDLPSIGATLTVTDPAGTSESVSGTGEAVLGHPAQAILWLVRTLRDYTGETIGGGEIVLPGAMARALPFRPGATATAVFSEIGQVDVQFSTGDA